MKIERNVSKAERKTGLNKVNDITKYTLKSCK